MPISGSGTRPIDSESGRRLFVARFCMTWIIVLIALFVALGLSPRPSERAKHGIIAVAISITLAAVFLGIPSYG